MKMYLVGANHQTELRDPSKGNGGRTVGVKRDRHHIGRPISADWTTKCSQRLDHQLAYMEGSMAPGTYVAEDGLL